MPLFIGAMIRWLVPALMGAAATLFKYRVGLWFASVLLWAGINFAAINIIIQPISDLITGYSQAGFGGNQYGLWMWQWAGVLQFDRAMTMILSAYFTRHAVNSTRLFLMKKA